MITLPVIAAVTPLASAAVGTGLPGEAPGTGLAGGAAVRPGTATRASCSSPRHRYSGITAAGSQYLPYQAHVDPVRSGVEISGEPESDGAWT